jgi:nitrogen-specific signal transduction histidine kinase
VLANQDQLIQVFLNLVKNAAEAVVDLGSDAEIQLTTAFRPGVRLSVPGKKSRVSLPLEFCVKDNGSGVPEDLLPNLFDPFVTTKADRQRVGSGAGGQDRRRSRRHHRMRIPASGKPSSACCCRCSIPPNTSIKAIAMTFPGRRCMPHQDTR